MGKRQARGKVKGSGTPTGRELRERMKKGLLGDHDANRTHNKLAQPQNRWQRFVRYVWDKKRG